MQRFTFLNLFIDHRIYSGFKCSIYTGERWSGLPSIASSQNKTKSNEKHSASTKMEMAKEPVNSGCCMQKGENMNIIGINWFMKQGKEAMEKAGTKNGKMDVIKSYKCSMHPEVISDKPGKCPKYGMALIEKK
jgi:hypothetical protein